MSNSTNFLESLSGYDYTDLVWLREESINKFSVDFQAVYCLHTGRKIGEFDSEEILFAIREEPSEDPESLIDSLIVRCVASMRPSPALNKPDHLTISNLASSRPNDALAFLINRLYGNRQTLRSRDDSSYSFLLERIRTWQVIDSTKLVHFDAYLHWLLELDSKMNLHDLSPPMFERDRLNKWFISRSPSAKPLIDCFHESDFFPCFEQWVFDHLKSIESMADLHRRQDLWTSKGNKLAGPAFVQSWLENPQFATRKAEALSRGKKKSSKPSARSTRSATPKIDQFMGLLNSAINAKPTVESSSAPKPPASRPKALLGSMLFKKPASQKDS